LGVEKWGEKPDARRMEVRKRTCAQRARSLLLAESPAWQLERKEPTELGEEKRKKTGKSV